RTQGPFPLSTSASLLQPIPINYLNNPPNTLHLSLSPAQLGFPNSSPRSCENEPSPTPATTPTRPPYPRFTTRWTSISNLPPVRFLPVLFRDTQRDIFQHCLLSHGRKNIIARFSTLLKK
ncbi:hypothetical protein CTAM01_12267, partial [Colletotrichum tamarilloi]